MPPSKPPIKSGDIHLVVSHSTRTMKAFDHDGKLLFQVPALTDGVNDDIEVQGGDTPPGLYKCTTIIPTRADEPKKTWNAYGAFFIDLYDIDGQETRRGRGGIGIHGGGTGLSNPLAKKQQLLMTLGCIRVHNGDLADRIVPIVESTLRNGQQAYVSVFR